MKMVTHFNGEVLSQSIQEYELFEIYEELKSYRVEPKSQWEVLRLRTPQELIIIYQENRKFRTRNGWFENRAIAKLIKQLSELAPIRRNVLMQMNGVETEVDGICSDGTLVEVKNVVIKDKHLEFYEMKRRKLDQMQKLILIGKSIKTTTLAEYPNIICYEFHADTASLRNYYLHDFDFGIQEEEAIPRRHIRFLLGNGHWKAQRSRYTKTAKWRIIDKFRRDFMKFGKQDPIKIYWSLAEMTGPLDEFHGKGTPVDRILAAFDIDGSHEGDHYLDRKNYCIPCIENARHKLGIVKEKLTNLGYNYLVYNSGAKGFHTYLLDEEDRYIIISQKNMQSLINQLIPYVDPFLSKTTGEFDMHRIFKIPQTVDASTGMIVSTSNKSVQFSDELSLV